VGWINAELALTAIAAMMSPTTLTFSVLALVLGDRPRRTGLWFYVGALAATLAIGVIAAFVLGDKAATANPSQPKIWVAIVDVVAAILLTGWAVRALRRPVNQKRMNGMVEQMSKIASSPVIAIIGAGATLANPGGFIPLALKEISETDPSNAEYIVDWVFFFVVSLLPVAIALVLLVVTPKLADRVLQETPDLAPEQRAKVAAAIALLLAAVLLRTESPA